MEYRPFGPTKREVPVIGQGTWYIDEKDREAAVNALRLGLDLGMTHIDTAANNEEIGETVRRFLQRQDECDFIPDRAREFAADRGDLPVLPHSIVRLLQLNFHASRVLLPGRDRFQRMPRRAPSKRPSKSFWILEEVVVEVARRSCLPNRSLPRNT